MLYFNKLLVNSIPKIYMNVNSKCKDIQPYVLSPIIDTAKKDNFTDVLAIAEMMCYNMGEYYICSSNTVSI